MSTTSNLNIDLKISESGLTPDATNIHQHHSVVTVPKSVSIYKKTVPSATVKRISRTSGNKDYYAYLKNTGRTNFDVRIGSADGDRFGNLAPHDFCLVRIMKGFDLYVKNVSSTSNGTIELSYWECHNDATTTGP
jgi:hypothetical protein